MSNQLDTNPRLSYENRAKLEARMRYLMNGMTTDDLRIARGKMADLVERGFKYTYHEQIAKTRGEILHVEILRRESIGEHKCKPSITFIQALFGPSSSAAREEIGLFPVIKIKKKRWVPW